MKECPVCSRCLADSYSHCLEDGAELETPFPGSQILDDKYLLLRGLGHGGIGRVYRARHLGLERLVAVKLLHGRRLGEPHVARFEREARILARLDHPHIVRVSDFGVDTERRLPYLVMELLEGKTFAARLKEEGPLPWRVVENVLEQVAAALDYAHAAGILHRDLKPANLVMVEETNGAEVKLVDFGLARLFEDEEKTPPDGARNGEHERKRRDGDLTSPGQLLGTPGFVAPEIHDGEEPSVASDVFSVGSLTYTLLTGERPGLRQRRTRVDRTSILAPSDLRRELPPATDDAILAALAPSPAERPPSATRYLETLQEAMRRAEAAGRRSRQLLLRCALAFLVALSAGAGVLLLAPALRPLDDELVDLYFRHAPTRSPGSRLLLVTFDEVSLEADATPLSAQAERVGELLLQSFEAGVEGVAIDLLLPQSWGRSRTFSDLLLRHPDSVVLASYSPPSGRVVGTEAVAGAVTVVLGAETAASLFGFVNVREDPDGRVRRYPMTRRDLSGRIRESFALEVARRMGYAESAEVPDIRLDYRIRSGELERLSWKDFATVLDREPDRLAGRWIVLGAEFAASGDRYRPIPGLPHQPPVLSGLALHGLAIETLLAGRPIEDLGRGWLAGITVLGSLLAAGALLFMLQWHIAVSIVVAISSALLASSWGLFHGTGRVLPAASVLTATLLAAGAAALARRWLETR